MRFAVLVQPTFLVIIVKDLLVLVGNRKDTFPMSEECWKSCLIEVKLVGVRHDRIIVQGALNIVILLVFLVKHCSADIGNIDTSVGFASHVKFLALEAESVDEILPPFDEFVCCLGIVVGCNMTSRKACANGIFDP
jgi:hypothetical protein